GTVVEMEAEAHPTMGGVPEKDRRLDRDGEQCGEIDMRRSKERAQLRANGDPDREGESKENAVVLGEHGETEQGGRKVKLPPCPAAVFPVTGEAMEDVGRGDHEKKQ